MLESFTTFGTSRGTVVDFQDNTKWSKANYQFVKTVILGKYTTKNETITVVYLTNPPVGKVVDTEYVHTFEHNYDTYNASADFNFSSSIGSTSTGGVEIVNGIMATIGFTTAEVRFSEGIANRLGYVPGSFISVDGSASSTYSPILVEPKWFNYYFNNELVATISPDKNFEYTTLYSAYTRPSNGIPNVRLTSDTGAIISIPVAFQLTQFSVNRNLYFRREGVTESVDSTYHRLNMTPGEYIGVKKITINDLQTPTGNESLLILGHKKFTMSAGYYIDEDYHIANTGTPLAGFVVGSYNFCIAYYNNSDYIATPVTGGEVVHTPTKFIEQTATVFKHTVEGVTDEPIHFQMVSAREGPLTETIFSDLFDSTVLYGSAVIGSIAVDDQDVTITSASSVIRMSFKSQSPLYKLLFASLPINICSSCDFIGVSTEYTLTSPLPISSRLPYYYEYTLGALTEKFAAGNVRYIEWKKNNNLATLENITIKSYDSSGKYIRNLTDVEFFMNILMRYGYTYH